MFSFVSVFVSNKILQKLQVVKKVKTAKKAVTVTKKDVPLIDDVVAYIKEVNAKSKTAATNVDTAAVKVLDELYKQAVHQLENCLGAGSDALTKHQEELQKLRAVCEGHFYTCSITNSSLSNQEYQKNNKPVEKWWGYVTGSV